MDVVWPAFSNSLPWFPQNGVLWPGIEHAYRLCRLKLIDSGQRALNQQLTEEKNKTETPAGQKGAKHGKTTEWPGLGVIIFFLMEEGEGIGINGCFLSQGYNSSWSMLWMATFASFGKPKLQRTSGDFGGFCSVLSFSLPSLTHFLLKVMSNRESLRKQCLGHE